ncbi:MAG: response regulator, partial [Deltaproteobacteria bacterium]
MSDKMNRQRRPVKLLLVDDEEGFVDVMSKRMARRNIQVTKALSGTEGIRALRHQDYDVAVIDLKMEDMDGIEVLTIL